MAPSTSPISIAFAVPMACAAEPIVNPLAIGSYIGNTSRLCGLLLILCL